MQGLGLNSYVPNPTYEKEDQTGLGIMEGTWVAFPVEV